MTSLKRRQEEDKLEGNAAFLQRASCSYIASAHNCSFLHNSWLQLWKDYPVLPFQRILGCSDHGSESFAFLQPSIGWRSVLLIVNVMMSVVCRSHGQTNKNYSDVKFVQILKRQNVCLTVFKKIFTRKYIFFLSF